MFLWTWVAPGSVFFADANTMEMVYVLEFASLHAAGFLMIFFVSKTMPRWFKAMGIFAMGAFYVGFFAVLGFEVGVWWPAGVMLIFVFDKIRHAVFRRPDEDDDLHFGIQWGGSTALFVLLTGLAFMLPWPHLGILPSPDEGKIDADGAVQAGSHVVIVAGFLYFGSVAALKYGFARYFRAHGIEG
jgi:hypothetical protein